MWKESDIPGKKNRYITECLPHLQSKGIKTMKEREMRSYTRKGVMVKHRPNKGRKHGLQKGKRRDFIEINQEIKLIKNLKKGGKQEKAEWAVPEKSLAPKLFVNLFHFYWFKIVCTEHSNLFFNHLLRKRNPFNVMLKSLVLIPKWLF